MERLTVKNNEKHSLLTEYKYLPTEKETSKTVLNKLGEYEDLEEQGRLIKLPISVENVVDKLFSHNEIVALWYKVEKDVTYHKLVWRGMAWDIPKKFKSCGFVKFFGTIPQNISKADVINIEVLLTEEAEKALAEMGE